VQFSSANLVTSLAEGLTLSGLAPSKIVFPVAFGMAPPPTIQRAHQGVANAVALGILGGLLLLNAGLMLMAFLRSPVTERPTATIQEAPALVSSAAPLAPALKLTAPPVTISPPPVGQVTAPSAVVAPTPAVPTTGFGPPPIGSFQRSVSPPATASLAVAPVPIAAGQVPAPGSTSVAGSNVAASKPPPPPLSGKTAAPGKSADPAADMTLSEMIDLAKQVRSLGDMQGALEVLKRADLQFPSAPEVLAETAQSYETMGLPDRAASFWKQLAAMEPARAGGFGDLARRRLNVEDAGALPSAPVSEMAVDLAPKVLSLGACTAKRDANAVNGEKVVVRIPILRQGNAVIDPSQVDIDVYFFDRVNGEKIAQTIADEPLSAWAAAPVDWSGLGEEPLEVTYFLPTLTPGEIAAHGRRAYHGYVVRLYYQHKLQDAVAEPRDLLDFGSTAPASVPAGGMNPLLPPVSN